MKTIQLLSLLFLASILVGCGNADASFKDGKVLISKKVQNTAERKLHEARYTFSFISARGFGEDYIFELPEDFGEVNDIVIASNKMLFAAPDTEPLEK